MKNILLLIGKLAVSATLVFLLLQRISLGDAMAVLGEAKLLPFFAAFLLFGASVFGGAWQWGFFLRTLGISISWKKVIEVYWVGLFFNNILPGNVGGDLVKVLDLKKEQQDPITSAAATLADRLTGLSALAFLALLASWLLRTEPGLETIGNAVFRSSLLYLFLAFLFLLNPVASGMRRLGILTGILSEGGKRWRIFELFEVLRCRKRVLFRLFLLSLLVQGMRVGVHFLVCYALIGSATPSFGQFFIAIPPLAFALVLPVTIGGLGLRESLAIPLFRPLGLIGEVPVALQFLAYLLMLLVSSIGGFVFLLRRLPSEAVKNR
ncbi:MAG: lysylphosphatidylglycerol synthase transmembrane domain-containing protein [Candidatus Krumholzibacteria bacterium]|nr:lysylphosphatidylglycerol synthase transmembrane domain-containing protein [Candidatus Krumholzibacteria bacterium]MDP6669259.1 lysylphosphatidylglycerol synthase transmembrane domain-containing protein [Candidatus Krumholzibacteria bacterium]MDP6797613.1 lysylphosphatidylglycerol synthase transmembrane domain-containing protein [Candidatus Krumholzibacteria bacterium]MDP7021644.1 lysylphosphatidylglycerol synthase transmembrane domain-containing protein [Candidatus Krumholzibacteria bacteriu